MVVNDDGLDGIAAGLQALLGGGSDDEEEADAEAEGKKSPAFVMETYKRQRPQQGPEELVLSLASSHHSLWGTCWSVHCLFWLGRASRSRGNVHPTRTL